MGGAVAVGLAFGCSVEAPEDGDALSEQAYTYCAPEDWGNCPWYEPDPMQIELPPPGPGEGGPENPGEGSETICEYWLGFSKTASGAANGMDLETTRAQACSNATNNAANACSGYGILCTSYAAFVSTGTGQGLCHFGSWNVQQQAYSYNCTCSATATCRYR